MLAGLTAAQREAATHGSGPMLVIAGPGSGKTRTLTARMGHLIEQGLARPDELLAVTFTRKAAAEMRGRLEALLGPRARGITVGTFHAVAALCRPPDRPVLSEGDRLALVRRAARSAGVEARRLAEALTRLKGNGVKGAGAGGQPGGQPDTQDDPLARGVSCYERLRDAVGAIDMDDILIEALEVLTGPGREAAARWRLVSVDEYQDVNRVQRELVRALAGPGHDVFAIGDPDQAIYSFRGADVGHFLAFADDFPGARVVHLADNFRSAATLVSAAAAVIGRNAGRMTVASPRASRQGPGPLVRIEAPTNGAEADAIVAEIERLVGGTSLLSHDAGRASASSAPAHAFCDIAVLVRTAARADALAEALDKAGIPIQRPRRSLLSRDEALDLLAYLAFAAGQRDAGTLLRVLHREAPEALLSMALEGAVAAGGVADLVAALAAAESMEWPEALSALDPLSQVDALAARLGTPEDIVTVVRRRVERLGAAASNDAIAVHESDELDPRAERVAVLTIHGAKGLEFPAVFIAGCEADQLPGLGASAQEVEEERRLFYVGMTRAKDRLYLSSSRRGKRGEIPPSPFLDEIPSGSWETKHQAPPRKRRAQMSLF